MVDHENVTPSGSLKGHGGKDNKSESADSEFITETEG